MEEQRSTVVVAGASGFVGRALGPLLSEHHRLVGITRNVAKQQARDEHYRWISGELFSLADAERALRGADYAIYLVHSMMPTAKLTQGSFRDLDLICADNFARAAASQGVKHIVYLGGLLPAAKDMSEHLASRLEVERVLGGHGVPVTTVRAGMVVGAGGSSYQMLVRLVRRLPAMICPKWTESLTQPVALDDVAQVIARSVGDERLYDQAYDVGVPEAMSYRQMMERTAAALKMHRPMFGIPLLSPRLSRLWVSLITGAPRALVAPLLESLQHSLVARDRRIYTLLGLEPISFEDAIARAIEGEKTQRTKTPRAFEAAYEDVTVRSVQRLELPKGRDAVWAADRYVRWLPQAMAPFLTVEIDGSRTCRFFFRGLKAPLLVLRFSPERSTGDRQLFYIDGGLLSTPTKRGRFELREVPNEQSLICAVHDFRPRLPWWLYRLTQAVLHKHLVLRFGKQMNVPQQLPELQPA